MNSKRFFLILSIILIAFSPFFLLHRSQQPVLGIWSLEALLFIILYTGLLVLSIFLYLKADEIGVKKSVYLFCVYIFSFLLVDYFLGSRFYFSYGLLVDHPVYHHRSLPGKHKLVVSDEHLLDHSYAMNINSQGLRSNEEYSLEKAKNCFRIMTLGDSFTQGRGVENEQTFSYLLEKYLNEINNKPINYEVLNAGVDSYVPILEYLYLKNDGIKFNPDLVILFLDMTDLEQTQEYLKLAIEDEKGNIVSIPAFKPSLPGRMKRFLGTRFYYLPHFYGAIKDRIVKKRYKNASFITKPMSASLTLKFTLSRNQDPWKKEWQRIHEDIDLMYNFCSQKDIGFGVVIYPWGHQVNDIEWALGRKGFGIPSNYTAPSDLAFEFEGVLKNKGIPILNLFPPFRNYKGEEFLYYRRDLHWTKYGHEFVARNLFDFVNKLIK